MKIDNELFIQYAKDEGFDLIGFAPYSLLNEETENLKKWLELHYQKEMSYMERNIDKKRDVSLILPDVKSIISLGINYYNQVNYEQNDNLYNISRYALGKDYHFVLEDKIKKILSRLQEIEPVFQAKCYVDSGPTMDKAWAVHAGLGWLAKNSNIINREIGSWFFIATIITNWEFLPSNIETDHCGSCRLCIDACPTNAIVLERVVDASKCISYLTLEQKSEIAPELKEKFNNWIIGCDICQEVCPWNNKFSKITAEKEFFPKIPHQIEKEKIHNMTKEEFGVFFTKSPVKRGKEIKRRLK